MDHIIDQKQSVYVGLHVGGVLLECDGGFVSTQVTITPDQADAIAKDLMECAAKAKKKAEASHD